MKPAVPDTYLYGRLKRCRNQANLLCLAIVAAGVAFVAAMWAMATAQDELVRLFLGQGALAGALSCFAACASLANRLRLLADWAKERRL